jgi:hypothetical protein
MKNRTDEDEKQLRCRIRHHECAHALANFVTGNEIERVWVARDFARVKKGENLGGCEMTTRNKNHFKEAFVSLAGEACDRILFNMKVESEICEQPWFHDAEGNLQFREGTSNDRLDAWLAALRHIAHREGDPFAKKIADDLLLDAWVAACNLVRDNEDTIRALAEFLKNQNDELDGVTVTVFLNQRKVKRITRTANAASDKIAARQSKINAEAREYFERRGIPGNF